VDSHFGGVRARYEIGGADQIEETLLIYPTTTAHCLLVHERDVHGGATDAESAEFEKKKSDFFETPRNIGIFHALFGPI
jgi:hypothetical protein